MRYYLALVTFALLTSCKGCEEAHAFGVGFIKDIKLHATESQAMILKLSNGIYNYCKKINLQSGKMPFADVACNAASKSFDPFPNYDISIKVLNAEGYEEETNKTAFFEEEYANGTSLYVAFAGFEAYIQLEAQFIHPTQYSYFWSASMKSLFIFTLDEEATIAGLKTFNLVSITFNSMIDAFPSTFEEVTDFVTEVVQDVNLNNFVGDAQLVELDLDGALWRVYDAFDMFMVEINSIVPSCSGREWLRYTHIDELYQKIKDKLNGIVDDTEELVDDGMNPLELYFDYIDKGFIGVDPRIKRAYGFSDGSLWYYEVDGDQFDAYRVELFDLTAKELASYWAIMWLGIAIGLICGCCCCWLGCRRGRGRTKEEGGMTPEQDYMTHV